MNLKVGFRPTSIGDDDLHAYVDGQLDVGRRRAIEAHLAARPEDAARAAAYRGQNIALHALFDPCDSAMPDAPAVDELGQRLAAALDRQRRLRRTAGRLAASAALAVVAGAAAWCYPGAAVWRGGPDRAAVAEAEPGPAAAVPHPGAPLPAAVGPGGGVATAAGLGGWLAARLAGEHRQWPDLRPLGLSLVGERAVAAADGLALQLAYEDAGGRGFVLHVELDRGELAPVLPPPRVHGGEVAFFWRSGPLVLGLVGEASRAELLAIAEAVAGQLNPVSAPGTAPGTDQERLLPVDGDPAAPAGTDDPAGTAAPGAAPKAGVVQEAGVDDAVVEPAPKAAVGGGAAGASTAPPPAAGDDAGGAGAPAEGSQPVSGLPPPGTKRA